MANYPGIRVSKIGADKYSGGIGARVRVLGVPQAIRKLKLVGSVAGRETGYITFSTAEAIKRLAQEIVHSPSHMGPAGPDETTGHLQKGIETRKLAKYDWMVTASSLDGGADREYAQYEEFGATTEDGASYGGHPFMRPAFAAAAPRARASLAALARKLERL